MTKQTIFTSSDIAAVWCGVADIEATVKEQLTASVKSQITKGKPKAKAKDYFTDQIAKLEEYRKAQSDLHGKDSKLYQSNNSKISKLKRVFKTALRSPVDCLDILTKADGIQAAIMNMDKSGTTGRKAGPKAPSIPAGAGRTVNMKDPADVYAALLECAKVLQDEGEPHHKEVAAATIKEAEAVAKRIKDAIQVNVVAGPQPRVTDVRTTKAKRTRKPKQAKLSKTEQGEAQPINEQVEALAARMAAFSGTSQKAA